MAKCFIGTLLLIAAALLAISQPVAAQVKVWESTLTLSTYQEGPPDPNPPFDIYQRWPHATTFDYPYTIKTYPYTLKTNLTDEKADHAWRAIFLENEYLKCSVVPDIGGHLYTCIDKISGQSMFYANPSLKKALIGYRGSWASFGDEFNFPVSHNWVSMSPVDFAYATHEDGSASVWVGNIDRAYGMQWEVKLVLKPGSTLLEQHVTLYNRSDVRHRFYFWNNAAVQVWDDSRIEYPMRFMASHGYTNIYRWPFDAEGKNISIIKNQTRGQISDFVHGSHEPFMGVWNPKTQTGTAHYAAYEELPAKKIFSWGVDQAAYDWRKVLADNDSAYVEVQVGLFRNQETYAFMDPGQSIHFSEYWMPVRGTGGISRANKAGVVYFNAYGSDVSVALNVNERFAGAQISLTQNGKTLWSETADLAPEKTWTHSVSSSGETAKVAFELKDSAGHSLLKQTDGEYDWDPESTIKVGPQPPVRFPAPAKRTDDDWLQMGRDQELRNGEVTLALSIYEQGLEKYPHSLSLQTAAGRLAAALSRFEEAEHYLQLAQERDTSDSTIAYYLGITEEGLGHKHAAELSYEVAYRQAVLRGPAAIRLGELRAREGDLQGAASFLKAALAAEPANLRAQEELEAVLRAQGENSESNRLANIGLAADPMSDFLKEDTENPNLQHLAADPYRVLRVASEYMRLGLYRQALGVLDRTYSSVDADRTEPGSVLPQQHPLVLYYAAYCKEMLGADAPRNWQTASELSTSLVFPSSETDRIVLEAALAANGKDATAHYLLGTLLFSKGLIDAGMAHWAEAKQLAPHMLLVDVGMGEALLVLKADPKRALEIFREGMKNDAANPELYVGLDEAMSLMGVSARERAATLSQYPSADAPQAKMPANLVYQLALTRAEAMQFEPALALFKDRFFPNEEGGIMWKQIQFEVKLMQAETWAKEHNCTAAQDFLKDSDAALAASRIAPSDAQGVQAGGSAREYVKLAGIARGCENARVSEEFLRKAAASVDYQDLPWAIQAEKLLGTYDAVKDNQRVADFLTAAETRTENGTKSGFWSYDIGLLQAAINRKEQARESFEKALILPDIYMSHHLAREALAELSAGK